MGSGFSGIAQSMGSMPWAVSMSFVLENGRDPKKSRERGERGEG